MSHENETEPEDVCGEAYDHDTDVVFEDDEVTQWVCRNCGAEGWGDNE